MSLEDYSKIQPMVQKEAKDIAESVYKTLGTQYGTPEVPYHIHLGTDSPQISYNNLLNKPTIPAIYVEPTGIIKMYGGSSAPTGYLFCDGSAVSRTTYAALFTVLSTTYGSGDASTTFNVPDMRGRAPVGVGTGTGGGANGNGLPTGGSSLSARNRADWLGEQTHTLITNEIPSHTHTNDAINFTVPGIGGNSASGSQVKFNAATLNNTGGDASHNNMQPVMTVQFIIKT